MNMKKKYVVYCMAMVYDEDGIMQYVKTKYGPFVDYESALIRAYELSSLGYDVNIEEE